MATPLILLQGFNIKNKDGLDNLVAIVNDAFSHNHKGAFTDDEYLSLVLKDDKYTRHPLGELVRLINEIHIEVTERDNLNCTPEEGIAKAVAFFMITILNIETLKAALMGLG